MDENIKGFIVWAIFLTVCAAMMILSRLIRKKIDQNGVEAIGVVSRVEESFDIDDGGSSISVHVRYRTEDGEEIEGLLLDAPSNLQPGQRVRVKYHPHPTLRLNAKLLEVLR